MDCRSSSADVKIHLAADSESRLVAHYG